MNKYCCAKFLPMKPIRLRILILILVLVGLMLGVHGYLATGSFGIWTAGTLTCFFTAHLLGIPHNSGCYWTAFVSLGLFAISAFLLASHFDFAGFHSANRLPLILALGIPLLYIMIGILILMLTIHSSVCEYFDQLDSPRADSSVQNE